MSGGKIYRKFLIFLCLAALMLTGCTSAKTEEAAQQETDGKEENGEKKIQIGLTVDSFVIERWIRDRDVFVATARDLGAEVNVQDAGADAQARYQAKRCKHGEVACECLREREDSVEGDGADEDFLPPDFIGEDAAECAADDHAEQAPCGERPHERSGVRVVRPKRVGDEQVGRVDDHKIIAVEYLGER